MSVTINRRIHLMVLPFRVYVLGGIVVYKSYYSGAYLHELFYFTIGYCTSCLVLLVAGVVQLLIKNFKGGLLDIVLSIITFCLFIASFNYVR